MADGVDVDVLVGGETTKLNMLSAFRFSFVDVLDRFILCTKTVGDTSASSWKVDGWQTVKKIVNQAKTEVSTLSEILCFDWFFHVRRIKVYQSFLRLE